MSNRTILSCDRCSKEAETEEQKKELDLHQVILGTYRRYPTHYEANKVPTYALHANWDKEWCLECRKQTGLAIVEKNSNKLPPEQVNSLEEMVREIVRQEVQAVAS